MAGDTKSTTALETFARRTAVPAPPSSRAKANAKDPGIYQG